VHVVKVLAEGQALQEFCKPLDNCTLSRHLVKKAPKVKLCERCAAVRFVDTLA
jgi:hypothetical protein